MHPRNFSTSRKDHPAVIMAGSRATMTYGELEARSNQVAQLFRSLGLRAGDTIA